VNATNPKLPQVISWVLHPLWVPVYLFAVLLAFDPYLQMQRPIAWYFAVVLCVSVLASALSILMMRRSKSISDLEVSVRKERFAPFMVVLLYQGLALWTVQGVPAYIPPGWFALLQAQLAVLAVAVLINLRFKASMHMMGTTGALGALTFFNRAHILGLDAWLPVLVLLCGAVAWARIRMGVHSVKEVLVGSLLGYFLMSSILEVLL